MKMFFYYVDKLIFSSKKQWTWYFHSSPISLIDCLARVVNLHEFGLPTFGKKYCLFKFTGFS